MDTKKVIFIAVIAALVGIGGYLYLQEQSTDSVSVEIGGKKLSATLSE